MDDHGLIDKLGRALEALLELYYREAPGGCAAQEMTNEGLQKRIKWLGPEILRVGRVILDAREALDEWRAFKAVPPAAGGEEA